MILEFKNPSKKKPVERYPTYVLEALNEHLKRVSSNFNSEQLPTLKELILANINYPEYPKDFDCALLNRYEKHSELITKLNTLATPSIGHLVKIDCKNGNAYEDSIITEINESETTVCVKGGGFIHSTKLMKSGVKMSVCGGYFLKVPHQAFADCDEHKKTFTFSGTGRVEAHCGVVIKRLIKRWYFDGRNSGLGFY